MDDLKQARDGDAFTDCSRLFQTEIPVTNWSSPLHMVPKKTRCNWSHVVIIEH